MCGFDVASNIHLSIVGLAQPVTPPARIISTAFLDENEGGELGLLGRYSQLTDASQCILVGGNAARAIHYQLTPTFLGRHLNWTRSVFLPFFLFFSHLVPCPSAYPTGITPAGTAFHDFFIRFGNDYSRAHRRRFLPPDW